MQINNLAYQGYWGGLSRDVEPTDVIPKGWIAAELPAEIPEGYYARLGPNMQFELTDVPPPEPPAPEPTLAPLTRRQLRLGLLSIGVTAEDVETQINAITDPVDRAAALIEWEDATHYKRDHPLVADVAAAMQLPPEQVDALWVWASGI